MVTLNQNLKPHKHLEYLRLALLTLVLTCSPLSAATLSAATLAVIYPEAPPPYEQVFAQIISGIKNTHSDTLHLYPLSTEFDRNDLYQKLDHDKVDMVITLGRRSFALIDDLKKRYPAVSGALPLSPGNISGVSLITSPLNLFQQLRVLSPSIKRVHVVFTPGNRWLIDQAKKAAQKKQLELVSYEVSSLQEALRHYETILAKADEHEDAIWLPLDRVTANEKVILPMLLRESWDRRLVLFSSKPSHVKRGTLFSLYPDNQHSGARLAQMVQEIYANNKKVPGVETAETINVGVNLRTASHLGLEYPQELKQTFYQIFPSP